jgi:GNAT superfamily N-acetyltransferase
MTLVNDDRAATQAAHAVRAARPDDASRLATALAGAFYEDRVFRWFSPDDGRRGAMLPGFFDVFVDAFTAHGETYAGGGGAGAALWAAPGIDPIAADPAYADRLAEIAGADAPRLFEIVEILEAHAPTAPHCHLQFLGVLPERQGAGLGGGLMAPVLERCDRDGVPAYLEATSDRNRALYERHGFRALGDIPLPGGPALWRMWREPIG